MTDYTKKYQIWWMRQMNNVVTAIPPSYDERERLETGTTESYLKYLESNGATHVMTTAGTSQFNLLDESEIHLLNETVASFSGYKILGVPPVSLKHAISFVTQSRKCGYVDDKSRLMALYPDRFYNYQTLSDYIKAISNACGQPVYVHAQKMRHAVAGDWNYEADVVNRLYEDGYLCGIKEEHSSLEMAYNFIKCLLPSMHIIVAGGSMRRYQFLESAGANSLLSGIGNIAPYLEYQFINSHNIEKRLELLKVEAGIFAVFMQLGWHRSLREALRVKRLTCLHNRQPWPSPTDDFTQKISMALTSLVN